MPRKTAPLAAPPQMTGDDLLGQIRREVLERERAVTTASPAPIRAMARLVNEVVAECRHRGIPPEAIRTQVINRTIGDIDMRRIVEHDARYDYRKLADLLGIALPGEVIAGIPATGERYRALRMRMEAIERDLLRQGIDLHMYELQGVGNLVLRAMLCQELAEWGIAATPEQVFVSNGSLDGLDKAMRGLRATVWTGSPSVIFPAPGFGVPEWEARTLGITPVRVHTDPAAGYKLTPDQLRAVLAAHPEARGLYLIFSNNPSAYSYTPAELHTLADVIAAHPEVTILADLAYTGTGDLAEERARVAVLARPDITRQVISFWTFSKVYSMTGDRFGWLCIGDATRAAPMTIAYANTIASPAAEWQLRFMATIEMLREIPVIRDQISALYQLRRRAFLRQLQLIDAEQHLFARINLDQGGTIYNWSQLRPGVTVFDCFATTGIAGVPGSAFGYDDDHVRFSVGIEPVPGWEALVAPARPASPRRRMAPPKAQEARV